MKFPDASGVPVNMLPISDATAFDELKKLVDAEGPHLADPDWMGMLAGLLIVVGYQTIKPAALRTVWQTGRVPRVVMSITFLGTLMMPLQYAVLLGVATSVMLYVFQGANQIRLVELVPVKGGFPKEQPVPRQLASRRVTGLYPYGSTMIGVLDRYARTLQGNGGRLMLAGVSDGVFQQLERTGLIRLIGRENVFKEQPQWGAAANQALETAQAWLESLDQPGESAG